MSFSLQGSNSDNLPRGLAYKIIEIISVEILKIPNDLIHRKQVESSMYPRQGSVKQWSNRSKIQKSNFQRDLKKKLSLTHGYLSLYRKVSYITLNNRTKEQ